MFVEVLSRDVSQFQVLHAHARHDGRSRDGPDLVPPRGAQAIGGLSQFQMTGGPSVGILYALFAGVVQNRGVGGPVL
jgi:hypothetical protein